MNLVNDPWIPIRRSDGTCELIVPWQLTDPDNPVMILNAPRPDLNGALMQFLIGLLQTAAAPESQKEWSAWLVRPPNADALQHCFEDFKSAFELCSDRGAFMQDFDALDESSFNNISELLIESPGGNTVKENKDHFIKREQVHAICPSCAVMALFTLQTNAPSGGQGHRTSLRGGGPLSTLVLLDSHSELPNDLWRNLWLNILDRQQLNSLTGDRNKSALSDIFPWLTTTRSSEKSGGQDTTPLDAHPLQMYWGMPRRIRIQWESDRAGNCDVCDAYSENLVSQYQTKNYGINYTGAWQHPLSPYTLNKAGDLLPQHAQPGGMTYQHWLKMAIPDDDKEPKYFNAIVVKRYREVLASMNARVKAEEQEQLRLYAFGYDMDNMKARCWYETTFPLFMISDNIRLDFTQRIQDLTNSASEFAGFVRSCVKDAWFKRPGDAKGDTSFLMQSFYHHTESDFFEAARLLQAKLFDSTDKEVLHAWHKTLLKTALNLFDYWAARGDVSQANPRRVAEARDKLKKLAYSKKIKEALQLPKKPKAGKTKREVA